MHKGATTDRNRNLIGSELVCQVTTQGVEGRFHTDLIVTQPTQRREMILFTNGLGRADFDEAHRFLATKFLSSGIGYCHMRVNDHHSNTSSGSISRSVDGGLTRCSFETIGKIILDAADFLRRQESLREVNLCLLGTGDGAASALFAAASNPGAFHTMILSGPRLATALNYISKNSVPTLYILGMNDNIGATTSRAAYGAGRGRKKLAEIPRASHLFREPGALEDVAAESLAWIEQCTHSDG